MAIDTWSVDFSRETGHSILARARHSGDLTADVAEHFVRSCAASGLTGVIPTLLNGIRPLGNTCCTAEPGVLTQWLSANPAATQRMVVNSCNNHRGLRDTEISGQTLHSWMFHQKRSGGIHLQTCKRVSRLSSWPGIPREVFKRTRLATLSVVTRRCNQCPHKDLNLEPTD